MVAEGSGVHRFGYMVDEEVVHLAKGGHPGATEFLIAQYRSLVENKARSYFVMGADREDVIQEGMIGLCKAIRDFQSDRLTKFRPFAELCVTRQIITAVKTATRQKHLPLNGYLSLDTPIEAEPRTAERPPSLGIEIPANLNDLLAGKLSALEQKVLQCHLEGLSYREMSERLNCQTKSIDNALQRVKKKISLHDLQAD